MECPPLGVFLIDAERLQFTGIGMIIPAFDDIYLFDASLLVLCLLGLMYGRGSIVFVSKFQNRDFDGLTHFEVP